MYSSLKNNDDFIPYALPEIADQEIQSVIECLQTGWITTGPKVKEFEKVFSEFIGGDVEAIAVNSATAGLHLGLEALGIGPDDEVITTTHTFTATAEIIRYLGATPVFVDVDLDSLCISPKQIELAITPRTKAIIPVHFGGLSADMEEIIDIAKRYNLKLMEDAAHALPTTCNGKLIGSLQSDIAVFSFYANKTMTTGEGGMLVTRDLSIANRVRIMRLHGINRDAFDRFTSKVPSWYYEVVFPGYKYNMTDIAAGLGIQQLKKVFKFQARRQKIAETYNEAFADLPLILPPLPKKGEVHSWHLYVIQLTSNCKLDRDSFIEFMFDHGIGCSVHYIPLHLHPYWRDAYDLIPSMFPNSQKIYQRCVSLPIYSKMTDYDIDRVVNTVVNSLL